VGASVVDFNPTKEIHYLMPYEVKKIIELNWNEEQRIADAFEKLLYLLDFNTEHDSLFIELAKHTEAIYPELTAEYLMLYNDKITHRETKN